MLCPNCHAENPDSARFCAQCGAPQQPVSPVPPVPPEPAAPGAPDAAQLPYAAPQPQYAYSAAYAMPPVPPQRKKRVWPYVVLGVLVAAILAAAALVFLLPHMGGDPHRSQEALLSAYFDALSEDDTQAVYDLLLPEAGAYIQSRDGSDPAGVLATLDDAYWYYGTPVDSWEITDTSSFEPEDVTYLRETLGCDTITNWIALDTEVTFEDGETVSLEIEVLVSGEQWYLLETYA